MVRIVRELAHYKMNTLNVTISYSRPMDNTRNIGLNILIVKDGVMLDLQMILYTR